jgi:hypothetical protein
MVGTPYKLPAWDDTPYNLSLCHCQVPNAKQRFSQIIFLNLREFELIIMRVLIHAHLFLLPVPLGMGDRCTVGVKKPANDKTNTINK